MQGTGEVTAGVLQDGLLVRDLQLPLGHKYAFLLRPLPTRAQVSLCKGPHPRLQLPPRLSLSEGCTHHPIANLKHCFIDVVGRACDPGNELIITLYMIHFMNARADVVPDLSHTFYGKNAPKRSLHTAVAAGADQLCGTAEAPHAALRNAGAGTCAVAARRPDALPAATIREAGAAADRHQHTSGARRA